MTQFILRNLILNHFERKTNYSKITHNNVKLSGKRPQIVR